MKAIITIGLPSTDKTIYAKDLVSTNENWIDINRDIIRRQMFSIAGWSEYDYSTERERLVSVKEFETIREAFKNGQNIIISDTNIRMKYVRGLVGLLTKIGYDTKIKIFDIELVEYIRRRAEVSNNIDAEALAHQHEVYRTTKQKVIEKYSDLLL